MSQDQVVDIEEVKRLLQKSLFFLCTEFLGYKDWDKVHDDVEIFLRKPARKKALLLPRSHLKTSIITIAFAVQQILKNPNVTILIANGVWDMARKFLDEIKGHLENSKLKYLFGEFVSPRWNADEIIVKQRAKSLKEPTILTTGVEAETTGGHFDLIFLDDLTGFQNSQTPEQRTKVKKFRRSMINLLHPGGLLIEVMTRWHTDDTFAEILEKESRYYDIMVRKVIEDGKIIFPKKFSKRFNDQLKTWEDQPDDPTCMDYIEHLKSSMPLDEFYSQYQNEPYSSEDQTFKPETFQYWSERPDGLFVAVAVDLAISEARTADETALVVAGMDKDWKIYVLDYLKGRWKPSDVLDRIFELRDKWKPHSIGMETTGFQKILKLACEDEMRKRHSYFHIDEIKTGPERSKTDRIKTLEPFYRNGKISHAQWMKGKDMEIQLQTFPKGKRDDIIDALSMALPFLYPGIGGQREEEREWSWDWCLKKANENMYPQRGFFEYGR